MKKALRTDHAYGLRTAGSAGAKAAQLRNQRSGFVLRARASLKGLLDPCPTQRLTLLPHSHDTFSQCALATNNRAKSMYQCHSDIQLPSLLAI
jgi:hypothetical protein